MDGFLSEIINTTDPSEYYSIGWKYGPPRGIMIHTGAELFSSGASVHFYINSDGEIAQHVSLMNRSWHASEASDYYYSIFHEVKNIEHPKLSDAQLESSALISAEIIRFAKERFSMTIPVIRAPGGGFSPGFKEHRDGLGQSWNPILHRDGLVGWNWQQYLDAVKNNLEDDDMALFDSKEDFRKEVLKSFVGSDGEGTPSLEPERVLEAMNFILGLNLKMKGGDRPSKIDAVQKGWDFANHLLSLDLESGLLDLPEGKIVGKISFG